MLSSPLQQDRVALYDQLAPQYDKLHSRWLKFAGGEAQAALEAVVRAIATPRTRLLDAGCGTGRFARKLIAEGMQPDCITLLDPSEAMLGQCHDLPLPKAQARLERLPFRDGEFDIVTCAWALETVPNTASALQELCRVVCDGGVLCLAFCADVPEQTFTTRMMKRALLSRNTGRFLSLSEVVDTIRTCGQFEVRTLPCNGPVAALIARRQEAN